MQSATERYRTRFRTVLEYIDAHLDGALTLEQLSNLACCSRFHFHRQFAEWFGIGLFQYVQQTRLQRASQRLAYHPTRSVLDIALDCGYDSPEAFARAFKKLTGQTPTAFRSSPDWQGWHARLQPLSDLRSTHMAQQHTADEVRIVDCPAVQIAILPHRGDLQRIGESVQRFIAWRRENNLPPSVSATYNILYDNPDTTPPELFRLDLCCVIDTEPAPNDIGITSGHIPAGRCAVLRATGATERMVAAIRFLYAEWLPASGEQLRDFPLYVQRVKFFPDVPEHEMVTDVFLPLI
ncbi:transcriptional regulator, AraC family [Andreprevotia lacus DSM 23236]|jgi:AraC family transcriptional regulator|uniref:Transcriptional regulator, AraC family n=1 Tax=Andreprevotia lacus DSM 23236 TaxID=1121001 RepID=A0A1W1XPY7_9NEIS|nr:AraC family transcriptional regulator [Andreprevotia lacus]SMC25578.1 transcriptional regulator, AraC family [Andreprevotia lacus DSM 23236]